MGKRKRESVDIELLQKKFKILQDQMKKLQEDKGEETESENEGSPVTVEEHVNMASDSDQDSDEKENARPVKHVQDVVQEEEKEIPIGEDLAEILGEDPLASKALDLRVHSSVLNRWAYWSTNGLEKEEKEKLMKKYKSPKGLEAPEVNPEIALKLPGHSKSRDTHMRQRQQMAGGALTCLGAAMTSLIEEEDSIDKAQMMERLHDAGRLMVELLHSQTRSRIALILAGVDRDTRSMLESTKPDVFLFGKNLADKVREARTMEKVANSIKKQSSHTNQRSLSAKTNLNSFSLQGRRPSPYQAGYRNSQGGQYRQRLAFRNKPQNQPFNRNARFQRNDRPRNQNRMR
ncbi:uncharacterized protein LOC123989206 [Osmia bicornis bicornis]|uniref:uncharacterized protein LOC123989206 n=1 Tax=Osmia bicornis bicornis TaxID=1437191 RepID=UPI001EAF22CF|nr:uncharacterized protein LOC123989206 [Osmia bicornis bicornis]